MNYLYCGECGFDAVVEKTPPFPYCPDCRGLSGHERLMAERAAADGDRPIGRDDRKDGVIQRIARVKTSGAPIIDGRAVTVYRRHGVVYVTPLTEYEPSTTR